MLLLRLVLLHGIVLLLLLLGVLRGSLALLEGFLHALGLLVLACCKRHPSGCRAGLALIVHGYLCLTLRGRCLGDCLVGIIGIGKRTAVANYWSTAETEQAVRLQLIAAVATHYYTLVMMDEQLAVTRENISNAKQTVEVMQTLKERVAKIL